MQSWDGKTNFCFPFRGLSQIFYQDRWKILQCRSWFKNSPILFWVSRWLWKLRWWSRRSLSTANFVLLYLRSNILLGLFTFASWDLPHGTSSFSVITRSLKTENAYMRQWTGSPLLVAKPLHEPMLSQQPHDAIITSLWRQNDVPTSFRRHNDVIFALCVSWGLSVNRTPENKFQ